MKHPDYCAESQNEFGRLRWKIPVYFHMNVGIFPWEETSVTKVITKQEFPPVGWPLSWFDPDLRRAIIGGESKNQ